MNHRSVFALSSIVILAGCGASAEGPDEAASTQEIIHGVADHGRHPAVVALLIGNDALCSGTLIGPRAVLTARHCVSDVTEEVNCDSRAPQIMGDHDPRTIAVLAGDDVRTAPTVAYGARLITPAGNRLCGSDVAVLVLDRDVHGITPLAVAAHPVAARGGSVAIVGFGRRSDAARAGVGVRYYREHVAVVSATASEFVTGEGSCNGDSGGPAIDLRTGEVVGVVSRGGERCVGNVDDSVWSHASLAAPLIARLR